MANSIDFLINLKAGDTKGLDQVKKQLENIQKLSAKSVGKSQGVDFNSSSASEIKNITTNLQTAQKQAEKLQIALQKAYNPTFKQTDFKKLNEELSKSNISIKEIQQSFSQLGKTGQASFRSLTSSMLSMQKTGRQTFEGLNKVINSVKGAVKYAFSTAVVNMFTTAVSDAISYMNKLDKSLNNIQIVTGKSSDEMQRFAKEANTAAQALGTTTTKYTDAALIFAQQGLGDKDIKARTETTVKVSNITGEDTQKVSEELTAVWNGYKIGADQVEASIDKLAAIAATSASSLKELSSGMQKVAAAANAMGVTEDQLASTLSTIISVTREAPESVGNAMKTIYARMSDLKLGKEDEDGVKLGKVSSQLQQLGIEIINEKGEMKDMGTVIEETAAKWGNLTQAQKAAAAQALAGKQQYNKLFTLFENWDLYEKNMATAGNSLGTVAKQNETYMNSTEAKMNQLQAATEGLYQSLLDSDMFKDVLSIFTQLINTITNLIEIVGGGKTVFLLLATVIAKMFGQQMIMGIQKFIANFQIITYESQQIKKQLDLVRKGFKNLDKSQDPLIDKAVKLKETSLRSSKAISEATQERINAVIEEMHVLADLEQEYQQTLGNINDFTLRATDNANISVDKREIEAMSDEDLDSAVKEIPGGEESLDYMTREQKVQLVFESNIEQVKSEINRALQELQTDSENAFNALDKLSDAAEDTKNYEKIGNYIKNYGKNLKEAQEATNKLTSNTKQLENIEKRIAELKSKNEGLKDKKDPQKSKNNQEIKQLQREQKKLKQETQGLQEAADKANKALEPPGDLKGSIGAISQGYSNVIKSLDQTSPAAQKLQNAFTAISQTSGKKADEIKGDIEKFKKAMQEAVQEIQKDAQKAQGSLNSVAEKAQLQAVNQKEEEVNKELDNTQKQANYEVKAKGIADCVAGVTALASAVSMCSNMFDIWNDSSKSTGERVWEIFTGILAMAPMVVTGITTLGSGLLSLIPINTAAGTSFTILGIEVNTALWPIALIIIAIIAVLALLCFALQDEQTEAEKAAQTTAQYTEALEKQQEKVKDLEDEHKNLQDTLKKYDDLESSFDKMVAGSEEWKKALEELNAQTEQLIDQYPKLAKLRTVTGDGRVLLGKNEEEHRQNIKNSENQKNTELAQEKYKESSLAAGKAKSELNEVEIGLKEYDKKVNIYGATVGSGKDKTLTTAGIGSNEMKIISEAMAAANKDANDDVHFSLDNVDDIKKALESKGVNTSQMKWLQDGTAEFKNVSDALKNNSEALTKYGVALEANTEAIEEERVARNAAENASMGSEAYDNASDAVKAGIDKMQNAKQAADQANVDEAVRIKMQNLDTSDAKASDHQFHSVAQGEDGRFKEGELQNSYDELLGLDFDGYAYDSNMQKAVMGAYWAKANGYEIRRTEDGEIEYTTGEKGEDGQFKWFNADEVDVINNEAYKKQVETWLREEYTKKLQASGKQEWAKEESENLSRISERASVFGNTDTMQTLSSALYDGNFSAASLTETTHLSDIEDLKSLISGSDQDLADSMGLEEGKDYTKDAAGNITFTAALVDGQGNQYTDMASYKEHMKEELTTADDLETTIKINAEKNVSNIYNNGDVKSLMDKGADMSTKEFADSEELKNVNSAMESLKDLYKDVDGAVDHLNKQQNILNDATKKGTMEWRKALFDVNQAMRAVNLQKVIDEANQEFDTVINQAKTLDSKLSAFSKREYKINMQLESNAEEIMSDFNGLVDAQKNAADMIGEGYQVSINDLEALSDAYPGILEGMTEVEDGVYQLSEASVQAAVAGGEAQVQSAADAAVKELEIQNEQLQAKLDAYKANMELLNTADLSSAETRKKVATKFNENVAKIDEANKKLQTDNEKEVVKNQVDNGKVRQENEQAIANEMVKASAGSALARIQNEQAVADKDAGKVTQVPQVQSKTPNTKSGVGSDDTNVSSSLEITADDLTGDNLDTLKEETQKSIDSLENQIKKNKDKQAIIKSKAANSKKNSVKRGSGQGGSGGGGGSDGGSGDEAEFEKKDLIDWEDVEISEDLFDIYHKINNELTRMEKTMGRIQKMEGRLGTSTAAIQNLDKQNSQLDKKLQKTRELYDMQKRQAAEMRETLSTKLNATFDTEGYLTNFDEIMKPYADAVKEAEQKKQDKLKPLADDINDIINTYNEAGVGDKDMDEQIASMKENYEEVSNSLDKEVSKQKKIYDEALKQLEKYEELRNQKMEDSIDKMWDIILSKIDNNMKKLDMKFSIRDKDADWNQAKLDNYQTLSNQSDFMRFSKAQLANQDKINAFAESMDIAKFQRWNDYFGTIGDQVADLRKYKEDRAAQGKATSDSELLAYANEKNYAIASVEEGVEKQEEAQIQILSAEAEMWNNKKTRQLEKIDKIYSNIQDTLSDINNEFSHINNQLSTAETVTSLLYGETRETYERLNKIKETSLETTLAEYDSLTNQLEIYKQMYAAEIEGSQRQKELAEQINSLEEQRLSKYGDALQQAKDLYNNTVSMALKKFEEEMTGSSLNQLQTEWDRLKKQSSNYLDDVQGMYQIQTLANKINKSISDTNVVKNQQALQKVYEEEVNTLREKKKLTQYDLDAANARYEIELKKQALEDAQNNKNTMKLVRDEGGDWSYQYVADQDDITSKQQELSDAYNKLYELTKNAYNQGLDSIMSLYNEFLSSYQQIATDTTLTEEQREEQLLALREYFESEYNRIATENQTIRNDLKIAGASLLNNLYTQDVENYEAMTNAEKELIDGLTEAGVNGYYDIRDALNGDKGLSKTSTKVMSDMLAEWNSCASKLINKWVDDPKSVKNSISDCFSEIDDASQKFKDTIDEIETATGICFSDEDGLEDMLDDCKTKTEELKDKTVECLNEEISLYEKELKVLKDIVAEMAKMAAYRGERLETHQSERQKNEESEVVKFNKSKMNEWVNFKNQIKDSNNIAGMESLGFTDVANSNFAIARSDVDNNRYQVVRYTKDENGKAIEQQRIWVDSKNMRYVNDDQDELHAVQDEAYTRTMMRRQTNGEAEKAAGGSTYVVDGEYKDYAQWIAAATGNTRSAEEIRKEYENIKIEGAIDISKASVDSIGSAAVSASEKIKQDNQTFFTNLIQGVENWLKDNLKLSLDALGNKDFNNIYNYTISLPEVSTQEVVSSNFFQDVANRASQKVGNTSNTGKTK